VRPSYKHRANLVVKTALDTTGTRRSHSQEHCPGRFVRAGAPPKRNTHHGPAAVRHRRGDAQRDALPADLDARAVLLGTREPRVDAAERDRVRAHAEGPPLLRNRLRKAHNGRLGRGVVCLADVAVQAGRGGDVDDRPVLGGGLEAHVRRGGTDEAEGRADVDLHDNVVCVVGHRV
jgi:hypothetical protein